MHRSCSEPVGLRWTIRHGVGTRFSTFLKPAILKKKILELIFDKRYANWGQTWVLEPFELLFSSPKSLRTGNTSCIRLFFRGPNKTFRLNHKAVFYSWPFLSGKKEGTFAVFGVRIELSKHLWNFFIGNERDIFWGVPKISLFSCLKWP